MKNKISLLIPTRKRPNNINRILEELSSYLNSEKLEIILGIDIDDNSYKIKSSETDEKGLTCDQRDKVIYEDYLNKYLNIQQSIILQ